MPNASSIVLNDGTNNLTFTPVAVSPEKSVFVCRSQGATSAGNPTLIIGFDGAKPSRATNKVTLRLNYPVEVTSNGVTFVRSTARHNAGESVVPDDFTAAERTCFANLVKNAYANTVILGYITSLEPVW